MKKVLCVLLAALLLLSAAACSTSESNGSASMPDNITTPGQQTVITAPTQESEIKEEKLEKFKFSQISVYCMVPENCARKTNGSIASTTDNKAYLATIFTGEKGSAGSLADILTVSADKYASDVNKYLSTNINGAELKAQTAENVTVSGYDAVKFSGQIKNIENGNYQIYGYSMIIEDRPIMFVGILCSDDQAKEDLDDMKDLIDLMAGSIYK